MGDLNDLLEREQIALARAERAKDEDMRRFYNTMVQRYRRKIDNLPHAGGRRSCAMR